MRPKLCSSRPLALLLSLLGAFAAAPAEAHPHVFVTAKSEVLFGPKGLVTGIRHTWRFDDMYSAFIVQGIGKPGDALTKEQLAPLAKTNVESLAEFKYFTVAKAGGKAAEFGDPIDYWNEQGSDKAVTLHFTLPLKEPVNASKLLILLVYDPTYFVAFNLDDKEAVTLDAAPSGCSTSVSKPKDLDHRTSKSCRSRSSPTSRPARISGSSSPPARSSLALEEYPLHAQTESRFSSTVFHSA